jgi:hypothetical protein
LSDNAFSNYSNKLEQVYRAYEKVLDLELALKLVALTEDEAKAIATDPDLLARLTVCDAKIQEELMSDFRSLAKNATSEGVRLSALKELGRTLYPKRFRDDPLTLQGNVTVTVIDDVK